MIPWLRELIRNLYPDLPDKSSPGYNESWQSVLKQLQSLSLLTPNKKTVSDHRIQRLHRLVGEHLCKEQGDNTEIFQQDINKHIVVRDSFLRNQIDWQKNRWEVEPLDALAQHWNNQKHLQAAVLQNQVGSHWEILNNWSRAESLMRNALKNFEIRYGFEHPTVAVQLNNLAGLLMATNRLKEAEELCLRSLETNEFEHPCFDSALSNLALILSSTSRHSEAEPIYHQALSVAKRFGENNPRVSAALNNLGEFLRNTNRLSEAEPLYRQALQIDEAHYGKNHPNIATGLNNLALLLSDGKRSEEVEPLFRRALKINEMSYGSNHLNVARDLNNLAEFLLKTNHHKQAEPLCLRALKIYESSHEEDHPEIANVLSNLGNIYSATKRYEEAKPLYERALVIDESNYEEDHPNIARDLNNLANLLHATGHHSNAEVLSRRMIIVFLKFTKKTGHEHPNLRTATENYLNILSIMNQKTISDKVLSLASDADWIKQDWLDYLKNL